MTTIDILKKTRAARGGLAVLDEAGKNALLLQEIQLRQKRLHIFFHLLCLKGIAVKAAIGTAQIAERNMQIQRRRLRRLQSKLLQHRPGHHPRQRFGLARNIGQVLKACFHSSSPRLAGQSLIIIALIKHLNIFCVMCTVYFDKRRIRELGETAVEWLDQLIRHGQFGFPEAPRSQLLCSRWIDGETLPPTNAGRRAARRPGAA